MSASSKKISYKKSRKKDRQQKQMEKMTRQMKSETKSLITDFSEYNKLISEFEKNITLLKIVCHSSVVAQFEKYKDQKCDPNHEKYVRLAELQNLNIALNATENDIVALKNVLSMLKKVRKDPFKSISIVSEQLIPSVAKLQIKIIDIFDMFKQCIPKNKEVLLEMVKTNPEIQSVLNVIDAFEVSMSATPLTPEPVVDVELTEALPMAVESTQEISQSTD